MNSYLLIIVGFFLTILFYPLWKNVNRWVGFNDIPNYRSSHHHVVPKIGGLMILSVVILSFLFLKDSLYLNLYITIAFGAAVFAGMIDDLLEVPAFLKLLFQIVIAWFLAVYIAKELVPHWTLSQQLVFDFFLVGFIVTLLNAQNLIDGVDGLSAALGVFQLSVLIGVFEIHNAVLFKLVWITLGALFGFLCFNISKKHKIFLGELGDNLIVFLTVLSLVEVIKTKRLVETLSYVEIIMITLGILLIPLVDLVRVAMIRIGQGVSPLRADQNHIHHLLLSRNWRHYQITLFLVMLNGLFFVLVMLFF